MPCEKSIRTLVFPTNFVDMPCTYEIGCSISGSGTVAQRNAR